MLIILQLLLMLTIGQCTDRPNFEAKTVAVGEDVKLTCPRDTRLPQKTLFWIKLVSGNFPEILGETFTLENSKVSKYSDRITAKQEPGTFVLLVRESQFNDSAVYYCVQVENTMKYLQGIFLTVKGPESDVTAITRVSPSDPVLPEDVVDFQCSVLPATKSTCGEERKLYWFKAGPGDAHPSPVFAYGNSTGECAESGVGPSQQECVYSFSKSVSSTDAGDYLCAVATCGQIVFGKPQKLTIEEGSMWPFCDLKTANVTLLVMFLVMAVTLVVTAVLVRALKTKSCDCSIAAVSVPPSVCNTEKQRDEDSCTNTAVFFTMMKGDGGRARDVAHRRRIHYAIKAFGFD